MIDSMPQDSVRLRAVPPGQEGAPVGDAPPGSASTCPPAQPMAQATQVELFGHVDDPSATGFALAQALASCGGSAAPDWLWVQDARVIAASGMPLLHGLPPALRAGLVHVTARKPEDALFALEEGLRCRDFAFVLGEMAGDPRALDFTASRRLAVASERHGVPLLLVRLDAAPNLSAARRRWRIAPSPSLAPAWNAVAPGPPRWHAELFRARDAAPGCWTGNMSHGWTTATPHPVDLAAQPLPRPVAASRAA